MLDRMLGLLNMRSIISSSYMNCWVLVYPIIQISEDLLKSLASCPQQLVVMAQKGLHGCHNTENISSGTVIGISWDSPRIHDAMGDRR